MSVSTIRVVSDGYFEAAGIRLQAGRAFTEWDRAPGEPLVIVNQTLARTLWPGQDPIGQVMTQDRGRRVIGVVADIRHEAMETTGGSEMYLPLRASCNVASGMAASRALSNTLGSLLFGVTSGDPVTYVGVGALLIVVAAVAGYIPAWRASRIDPMVALRSN